MLICRQCSKPSKKKSYGKRLSGKKLIDRMSREKTDYSVVGSGCLDNCKKGPIVRLSDSGKTIKYATKKKILGKIRSISF